jgi:glycosyltransferase EpsD
MKKVLFVENSAGFCKFNAPYMNWFKQQGWQVDHAAPGIEDKFAYGVTHHYDVDIHRSPFSFQNIKAIKTLKRLIDKEQYDLVHCHTEMGGLCARLAAISARKKGCKVIYTSHNYPFYKGASFLAWTVFYTVERMLAPITDAVVTINEEDYQITCKHKFAAGPNFKIDGVGVNLDRFSPVSFEEKMKLREDVGVAQDAFVLLYTAQFIPRKNHEMLIRQVPTILKSIPNLHVLFAGNGPIFEDMKLLANELGVSDCISFLGGRGDIDRLCRVSDLHVATSKLEGQGINNIEAMACGCPLVVSRVRGHRDVCIEGKNGFLFDLDKPQDMSSEIIRLYNDKNLYHTISEFNKKDASRFDVKREVAAMAAIYKKVLGDKL